MKSILFFIILTLVASCSSGTKIKGPEKMNDLNDEFAWIENSDFKPPKEVPFRRDQDNFITPINKPALPHNI